MAQDEASPTTNDYPPIGKNLFWDDYRIGLKVVAYGILTTLAAAILLRFVAPPIVVVIASILTAGAAIFGLKICCSIPEETGLSWLALGALGSAKIGVLIIIVALLGIIPPIGNVAGAVLGVAAIALFTHVMNGTAKHLNLKYFSVFATAGFFFAAGVGIVFILLFVAGLMERTGFRILMELAILFAGGFTANNAMSLARIIRRGQEELPLEVDPERPPVESKSTEEDAIADTSPAMTDIAEPTIGVLRVQDGGAARALVYLMTGVFSIGVVLYTIVSIWTAM